MPWWIWLILALFMLAMLVAGIAYAAVHGLRALRTVTPVGERIGERLNAMTVRDEEPATVQPAIFTEPLQVAADRYADAHAVTIRRREDRQDRHARTWEQWSQFNA